MAVARISGASCNFDVYDSGDLHFLFGAFLAHCGPKPTVSLLDHCDLLQPGLPKKEGHFSDNGEFQAMLVKSIADVEKAKSAAVAEARISNLYAKMVELTASLDRMNTNKDSDTQIREASIVKTSETHYTLLDARIENGEKESKNWSHHRQRAFVKTTWRMLR